MQEYQDALENVPLLDVEPNVAPVVNQRAAVPNVAPIVDQEAADAPPAAGEVDAIINAELAAARPAVPNVAPFAPPPAVQFAAPAVPGVLRIGVHDAQPPRPDPPNEAPGGPNLPVVEHADAFAALGAGLEGHIQAAADVEMLQDHDPELDLPMNQPDNRSVDSFKAALARPRYNVIFTYIPSITKLMEMVFTICLVVIIHLDENVPEDELLANTIRKSFVYVTLVSLAFYIAFILPDIIKNKRQHAIVEFILTLVAVVCLSSHFILYSAEVGGLPETWNRISRHFLILPNLVLLISNLTHSICILRFGKSLRREISRKRSEICRQILGRPLEEGVLQRVEDAIGIQVRRPIDTHLNGNAPTIVPPEAAQYVVPAPPHANRVQYVPAVLPPVMPAVQPEEHFEVANEPDGIIGPVPAVPVPVLVHDPVLYEPDIVPAPQIVEPPQVVEPLVVEPPQAVEPLVVEPPQAVEPLVFEPPQVVEPLVFEPPQVVEPLVVEPPQVVEPLVVVPPQVVEQPVIELQQGPAPDNKNIN